MKLQTLACAVAVMTGGLFFSYTVNEAIAATTVKQETTLAPSREQALVTRQVATLVDRQHYLDMRLDANVSKRILDMTLAISVMIEKVARTQLKVISLQQKRQI